MRIGCVVTDFPVFSETFIQREVAALGRAGHRVFVYTNTRHEDAEMQEAETSGVRVSVVPFMRNAGALERAARADGVEHLHSSLMIAAHRAAWTAARALQVPVTFRTYGGHDVFTLRDADLYRAASDDLLFAGFIAEDAFMRDWLVERLGADASKIHLVPNSLDLSLYARRPAPPHDGIVILAIARFVEKKGLIHLVEAFNRLSRRRPDMKLTLVGKGPEEPRLRRACAGNPRVEFTGALPAAETLGFYAGADIFCLPCVRADNGDADGVPTTVLEAMACELPVVTSDLMSMPCYLTSGRDGLLTPPSDVDALEEALERLCDDAALRRALGAAARARVSELCDLDKNTAALERVFGDARRRLWRSKLAELERQRDKYTPDRERYYVECRQRAIAYFKPTGRLLDIGCDQGKFRLHLPGGVTYHGCDFLTDPRVRGAFPFVAARAEALPYRDGSFDSAVLFSVLPHVFDVDAALAEAARVIRPGGHLYLQECYNDANPIHINHLSDVALHQRVGEHFRILASQPANEYLMWMIAQRPDSRPTRRLVSIGITAYNRASVIRRCIQSALRQTHAPVEVVVVDDGSTDGTAAILDEYGSAIRVVRHERNLGRVAAKNDALRATSEAAAYVALLDSDDYYHPRFVESTVEFLESNAGIGLVYSDDVIVDGNGRELRRQRSVDPWDLDVWLRTRNIRGDTWLARRELVMRTALMDPAVELDEDYDLFYQLLEITAFGHLPQHLVYITHNPSHSAGYLFDLARCHAANLVKYGYSSEYAYYRARSNPEWAPAIEQGIALGRARRGWRTGVGPRMMPSA